MAYIRPKLDKNDEIVLTLHTQKGFDLPFDNPALCKNVHLWFLCNDSETYVLAFLN